jgi:hypothetical protein
MTIKKSSTTPEQREAATEKLKSKKDDPHGVRVGKSDVLRAQGKEGDTGPKSRRKTEEGPIIVSHVRRERALIRVFNDNLTPRIDHNWTLKAIEQMLQTQILNLSTEKEKKKLRKPRDPWEDFLGALYVHRGGGFGFPAVAMKNAMITAISEVAGVSQTRARRAFFIFGRGGDASLIQARGWPYARLDNVEINAQHGKKSGTADLRIRPEFREWTAEFEVEYLPKMIDLPNLTELVQMAGMICGIGGWRIERGGNFGAFRLPDSDEEFNAFAEKLPLPDVGELTMENTGLAEILSRYSCLDLVMDLHATKRQDVALRSGNGARA